MFDHVLVPLDHSELAEKALRYASHMVAPNGQMTLLMVLDVVDSFLLAGDEHFDTARGTAALEASQHEPRQRAEVYLQRIVDQYTRSDLIVQKLIQIGHPPTVIVDTAQRLEVQALVISTHGRTGLSRWLLGSVTQKVLAVAPCPVLVIPSHIIERNAQD